MFSRIVGLGRDPFRSCTLGWTPSSLFFADRLQARLVDANRPTAPAAPVSATRFRALPRQCRSALVRPIAEGGSQVIHLRGSAIDGPTVCPYLVRP
jgi:hypothetical protein